MGLGSHGPSWRGRGIGAATLWGWSRGFERGQSVRKAMSAGRVTLALGIGKEEGGGAMDGRAIGLKYTYRVKHGLTEACINSPGHAKKC